MDVSEFDYDLPESAIAQAAIEPRDAARLLVADTLDDLVFTELPSLLNEGDVVVVNNTRVRPARVHAVKTTGGKVEVLLTKRIEGARWEALLRPARRIREGTELRAGSITMTVVDAPDRGVVTLEVAADRDLDEMLPDLGEVPLPPYFHGTLDDDERYQTMFAAEPGSAAAPTAALHFTRRIVDHFVARGIRLAEVELEVGLDTFRPMADGPIEEHDMHRERYTVPAITAEIVNAAKRRGSRVVGIGTTVVRTLETSTDEHGIVHPGTGSTDLFISPGYDVRAVDAVLTNFHAPRTTLIVMIATLIGPRWREVYAHALASGYRFLSFGDAMYIEVDR
ncbi:MAG: tRNA preQ1(34) S-adenosylmethionine ribosyltransferase-isomerase QueA [Actinomycetota bacterium]